MNDPQLQRLVQKTQAAQQMQVTIIPMNNCYLQMQVTIIPMVFHKKCFKSVAGYHP